MPVLDVFTNLTLQWYNDNIALGREFHLSTMKSPALWKWEYLPIERKTAKNQLESGVISKVSMTDHIVSSSVILIYQTYLPLILLMDGREIERLSHYRYRTVEQIVDDGWVVNN